MLGLVGDVVNRGAEPVDVFASSPALHVRLAPCDRLTLTCVLGARVREGARDVDAHFEACLCEVSRACPFPFAAALLRFIAELAINGSLAGAPTVPPGAGPGASIGGAVPSSESTGVASSSRL